MKENFPFGVSLRGSLYLFSVFYRSHAVITSVSSSDYSAHRFPLFSVGFVLRPFVAEQE